MTVLRCDQLSIGYGRPLLPPIDLRIEAGEFWAVVGRNGSGKSTWFKTVLGLLPAISGTVEIDASRVAYVAQRRAFDALFPVTGREVVAMGRVRGDRPRGFSDVDRAAVQRALEEVGAGAFASRTFRSLSEGQKQRVLLARMLASEPSIALLDEPTAAMDAVAEAEAMDLIDRLRTEHGMAVVIVSHHLSVARKYAQNALFVDDAASCVLAGPAEEVWAAPEFQRRYGAARG